LLFHRDGRKRWNGGGRRNVFRHAVNGEKGIKPHPTTKPLALIQELVELFSEPGELVCDPYAGSGTTGVACRMLGRRFLGWEQDPAMAEIARRRIAGDRAVPVDGQMEMF
jgi:site-specific DNA-methyltransferase (adenine-specific)